MVEQTAPRCLVQVPNNRSHSNLFMVGNQENVRKCQKVSVNNKTN